MPDGDGSALRRALARGERNNSNLFRSRSTGRTVFTVNYPVMREGRMAYVLNIGIDPAIFGRLVQGPAEPGKELLVLVDGNNLIVGRWHGTENAIGKLVSFFTRI